MLRNLMIAAAAAAMSFAFAGTANAALKLFLSDGVTTIVVEDQDFAPAAPVLIFDPTTADLNATAGIVSWNGTIGTWTVFATVGVTKPAIGSALDPQMDLFNAEVSGGAGTLTVAVTDTGFLSVGTLNFNTEIGGTTDGTLSFSLFADTGNAEFGSAPADLVTSLGPFAGAFSASQNDQATMTAPWSMTAAATITHTAAGQVTSFDARIKVPEPRTLALFGIGLLALGLLSRRRRFLYAH